MAQTVLDDAVQVAAQAYASAAWALTDVRHHEGCYGWGGLRRRRVPFPPREPRRSQELEETRQQFGGGALEAAFPQRTISLSCSFTPPDGEWAVLVAVGRRIDVQVGWTRILRATPDPAADGTDELDLFQWPTIDLRRIRGRFTSVHGQEVTGLTDAGPPRGVRELHITNAEIDCAELADASALAVLDADRARLRHPEVLLGLPRCGS